jgi:hypothetical protein
MHLPQKRVDQTGARGASRRRGEALSFDPGVDQNCIRSDVLKSLPRNLQRRYRRQTGSGNGCRDFLALSKLVTSFRIGDGVCTQEFDSKLPARCMNMIHSVYQAAQDALLWNRGKVEGIQAAELCEEMFIHKNCLIYRHSVCLFVVAGRPNTKEQGME